MSPCSGSRAAIGADAIATNSADQRIGLRRRVAQRAQRTPSLGRATSARSARSATSDRWDVERGTDRRCAARMPPSRSAGDARARRTGVELPTLFGQNHPPMVLDAPTNRLRLDAL